MSGVQYFEKKTEVSELQQQLKSLLTERSKPNCQKRREAIKKVLGLQTLNIDVARLYPEMVHLSATDDVVQKKCIYMYLVENAKANLELATLCINTLLKDSNDQNPIIRGLALRSLCSLNIPNLLDYLEPVVRKGLADQASYVRKIAVFAVLQMFHLVPAVIKTGNEYLPTIKALLADRSNDVVINALYVLHEISHKCGEGGLKLTKTQVILLMNKITGICEWGQTLILQLLLDYEPADDDERFALFNVLDALIGHSSPAVVCAVCHVFLKFTRDNNELLVEVIDRFKNPFLTLMTTSTHEASYGILCHILVLLQDPLLCPTFVNDYKSFYVHHNDPSYIKLLKLKCLQKISHEENIHEIIDELSEYCTDLNLSVAKSAATCLGHLSTFATALPKIVTALSSLVMANMPIVSAEALAQLQHCILQDTQYLGVLVQALPTAIPHLQAEADGLEALISVLGNFGEYFSETPYWLEKIGSASSVQDPNVPLLLGACIDLFFKRPPEVFPILTHVLSLAVKHENPAIRDRARFIYHLFAETESIDELQKCLTHKTLYASDDEPSTRKSFVFNQLAVVLDVPLPQHLLKRPIFWSEAPPEEPPAVDPSPMEAPPDFIELS